MDISTLPCLHPFSSLNLTVLFSFQHVNRYNSFSEMLHVETLAKVLPGVQTIEEGDAFCSCSFLILDFETRIPHAKASKHFLLLIFLILDFEAQIPHVKASKHF